MIHTQYTDKNIYDEVGNYSVIHYFGKDIPEQLQKYINCEVETKHGKGIIIGVEYNESVLDDYFMIYYPEADIWSYELINDTKFCREIEKENNLI